MNHSRTQVPRTGLQARQAQQVCKLEARRVAVSEVRWGEDGIASRC